MKKRDEADELGSSGLVDDAWYAGTYRDVPMLGMKPAQHYLKVGARLLRNPGPGFDTAYYLERNPDVAASGINPLLHYVRYGRAEGRRCLPVLPTSAKTRRRLIADGMEPLRVRHLVGLKQHQNNCKTVLVCAHLAGKHLFGGERSLLDVLDGFSQLGYNVIVAAPGGGGAYLQALRLRCVEVLSFRYGWWIEGRPFDEVVVAEFANIIEQYQIDAVHVNTIMLREPLVAARRMGVPAVLHARELITHDEALCRKIGEEPTAIVSKAVESADWIIANSHATASCFAKADRTRVVSNTVGEEFFEIPSPGEHGIRIGLISSNLPKKGIHDFVDVARALWPRRPDARFVLVGPDNAHVESLKEDQAAGRLPPNLIFSGYRQDPTDALEEVDVVLNLSHFQESFGRTVLEAMAAGRPTVVYDWGALPELVVDGETGFVVPFKDVGAVADRLNTLCSVPGLISKMGQAARARARSLFTKSRFADELRSAYKDVLGEFSSRPVVLPARDGSACSNRTPLRIAYFLWHFPVPSETFVLNELRILVEKGHDVHVFCRQSPHEGFAPDFPIEWTKVADPADLADKLKQTGRTVVHSHFVYPTVTEMVWPACEIAEIPFTFIAHAQDIFRYANDRKNRIGEIARSPLCLRVLVPSRFHARFAEDRGVPKAKILINPNGIDPDLYRSERIPDPSRSWRSICAIHRFTEKKGLENLIRAAQYLAEDSVEVHLYGYGELEGRYRDLIEANGFSNVHLHGPVKGREEMLDVFSRHDLFACPSVRAADGDMDGIPTVLMEAMASGMPVLTTSISGIPDLVQDEVTGIVCEATPHGIAEAVTRFYSLREAQVAAIIEDAQNLIRREFDAKRLTLTLLRLWQRQTIDVLIVSWNNVTELQEVIRRLQLNTSMPWHLIICDNGSGRPVLAYLCEVYAAYENVTIVLNRTNAYVGPGTNICLEHGVSDYAVYVCGKEGFVLSPGWENQLIRYMDEHPEVGMAGTLCHSPTYLTGAQYPAAVPDFPKFRNRWFAEQNPDRLFAHVQGGLFVLRRKMYEDIGGFSDAVPHNYTDVEYSYYAESRGWLLGSPPGVLALFNKTRPGIFSRIDESVRVIHPPRLEDLQILDRIAGRDVAYCNICQAAEDGFLEDHACRNCGAKGEDRSLFKFLAESTLTYRRLPALGINVGVSLHHFWQRQFQGILTSDEEFLAQLNRAGRLAPRSGSLRFAYVNHLDFTELAAKEISRLLAPDGVLLIRLPAGLSLSEEKQALGQWRESCGLPDVVRMRYSSSVSRYDVQPFFLGRRNEETQCVC